MSDGNEEEKGMLLGSDSDSDLEGWTDASSFSRLNIYSISKTFLFVTTIVLLITLLVLLPTYCILADRYARF